MTRPNMVKKPQSRLSTASRRVLSVVYKYNTL